MHPSKEEKPVSEKIIVLVSDRGDSKHGEVSVLDDPQKAERLLETLREPGSEPERIRVFTGRASEFEISHRPVVALMAEGEAGEPQARAEGGVVGAAAPPGQGGGGPPRGSGAGGGRGE